MCDKKTRRTKSRCCRSPSTVLILLLIFIALMLLLLLPPWVFCIGAGVTAVVVVLVRES